MKTSKQVKDLIKNIAKDKNINAQILLRNYMLERFLERISKSEYKNNFVLKGGMLIASMVGINQRSTVDLDTTIRQYLITRESITKAINSIIQIQLGDGVDLELIKIDDIRDEADYNGFRVSLEARLEGIKIPLKIDITTGDEITPCEVIYQYELLLENRKIEIMAYNLETVLAEKIETIISRGTANTRLRDFYDVHILRNAFDEKINYELLTQALIATSQKRHSRTLMSQGEVILKEIFENSSMEKLWNNYQNKYSYSQNIQWKHLESSILELWNIISR